MREISFLDGTDPYKIDCPVNLGQFLIRDNPKGYTYKPQSFEKLLAEYRSVGFPLPNQEVDNHQPND